MIKIVKPIAIPNKLLTTGKTTDAANRVKFDSNPAAFLNGLDSIKVSNKIYGHATVKKVLKKAQENKCCFCEKDQVDEDGNVEHFRPKEGYKSLRSDRNLKKPGYYWLGYDWENLFFVCGRCNSVKYKGNLFPLVNEKCRARSHNDNLTRESSLLIDPSKIDPRMHIKFDDEFVRGVTQKGIATIGICGLDRDALNGMRRSIINTIDDKVFIIASPAASQAQKDKARKYLKECVLPDSPFSAAAQDYLKNFNIVVV